MIETNDWVAFVRAHCGDNPQTFERFQRNAEIVGFDRVLNEEVGVSLTAVKSITRAAPYFPDHFPNKPVLPMTILLESFLNLTQEFIQRAGYSGVYICHKMRRVKMSGFISPGDIVIGILTLKQQTDAELVFTCRTDVSGKRIGVLEITMKLAR